MPPNVIETENLDHIFYVCNISMKKMAQKMIYIYTLYDKEKKREKPTTNLNLNYFST